MIAALDVHYDDAKSRGVGAAVVFEHWEDAVASTEITTTIDNIQPYIPGEFYRRELPCLLAVISQIQEPLDAVVVDSYVQLGNKPGLGQHLYEHFNKRIRVIGVAKTPFQGARAVEVLRGNSRSPLLVTTAGFDPAEAARCISRMHGPHRIPTLLKSVDRLARIGAQ